MVLVSGVLFGTTGTASLLANVDASSTAIGSARLLVGSVGLIAVSTVQRGFFPLFKLWRRPRVWVMGISVASYMLTFFTAVKLAGAAVAALVAISLAPMIAGAIARIMGTPWPGKTWAFATSLAVLGVVLLSAPTSADSGNSRVIGALFATLAGASYAYYTVLGAKLVEDKHHATDTLAASFSLGSVFILPFLFLDPEWLFTSSGIGLALGLGLISTTIAYVLFGVGITHLTPGVVATLLLSEPAVATLLGVFLLGEPMAAIGWFGCFLILVGLALVSRSEQKKSQVIAV